MDIRQTSFWNRIEGIFEEAPPADRADQSGSYGGRVCSRAQFLDRLHGAVRRAGRHNHYVMLILLQLGPQRRTEATAGDRGADSVELLICRLGSFIRSSDSLCNLGEGRFAVLMEEVREPSAVPMVIDKLNATLLARSGSQGNAPRLWANLGVSLFRATDLPVEQIWQQTAAALEQAIGYGPGCYSISPVATERNVMERVELSRDLYRAYRNNEFETVYQPIVDVADRRVLGLEVLLRWRHPERGYLYPAAFLPLLEESGLIVPVGERLLNDACQTARKFLDEGHTMLRVCVNISARQLVDRGFMLTVLDALYDSGLPPEALQLEFPESVLGTESGLLRRLLPELKTMGVKLAIDQFGTGKAALAELACLPVDLVKLDPSLVNRLPNHPDSRAVVTATLALAQSAGMAVAGVGVEHEAQTGILDELGCREMQGRYYSDALPVGEIGVVLGA